MKIMSNWENNKVMFGETKRWFFLGCDAYGGNVQIEYRFAEKIYIVSRSDGKTFDGTEDVGGLWQGNMIKPNTLEEILEHEVGLLSSMQIEPESNMFSEFDFAFNEDRTKVIIYPVFLNHSINVEVNINDNLGQMLPVTVSTVKRVRKNITK